MIRDVAESTGVVLDPVFTVKAFIGMISEMKKDPMQFKGKRVLFLHTGTFVCIFVWYIVYCNYCSLKCKSL